jgi:hypothetical protein
VQPPLHHAHASVHSLAETATVRARLAGNANDFRGLLERSGMFLSACATGGVPGATGFVESGLPLPHIRAVAGGTRGVLR